MRARLLIRAALWFAPLLWIRSSAVGPPLAAGELLPEDRGAAGLWQALEKLRTTASVLHITAHPDDEDGPTLTLLARGRGARTMLLALTRGEGGADLIAPHFFDGLGVLRTLEFLQCDRYYGVKQFFTRAVDYGYSKRLEEALASWGGEEEVLRDVVRVVRRERPDVIIARFQGEPRDGHGHHMFSGLMARRAFQAAADPARFPEQLREGLRPWQAKKLYQNNINPAFRAEDREAWTLMVEPGEYSPLLGRSYYQIAREGYSLHRSQGMGGRAGSPGPHPSYYRLLAAADPGYRPERERSFFDGLDTSLQGIAARAGRGPPEWLPEGLKTLSQAVEAAVGGFDPRSPGKIAEPLAAALTVARSLARRLGDSPLEPAAREEAQALLERKGREIESALAKALGLELEAVVESPRRAGASQPAAGGPLTQATPGQSFPVRLRVWNQGALEVELLEATLRAPPGTKVAPAEEKPVQPADSKLPGPSGSASRLFTVELPEDAPLTRPYWHRETIEETLYHLDRPELQSHPLPPPALEGVVRVKVLSESITLAVPVEVAREDVRLGSVREPLPIVPALSVGFTRERGVIPAGREEYRATVTVHSNARRPARGDLTLRLPAGWRSAPASVPFAFEKENEEASFPFVLSFPGGLREVHVLEAVAMLEGKEFAEGYTEITAPDLPRFYLYRRARHLVRKVDLQVASGLRLGYVMGSGDEVPQSLEPLGVQLSLLGPEELRAGDLSGFDAVIVGVRAYAVRPDLRTWNARLLEYVKGGGVLIVQYQTPEFDQNYGPYPYSMGQNPEEVSEEDSQVTILAPEEPLFTAPNKITPSDFDGWVEERGSKFWRSWDERYRPLLECHDHGQEPQKGGMLAARYGKGVYVYTAYAWYRQLPFAVPGAFRIYANMISLRRTLGARG